MTAPMTSRRWLLVAAVAMLAAALAQLLLVLVIHFVGFRGLLAIWTTLLVGGLLVGVMTGMTLLQVVAVLMALKLWWHRHRSRQPVPERVSRYERHAPALIRTSYACLAVAGLLLVRPPRSLLFELGWRLGGADLASTLQAIPAVTAGVLTLWAVGLGGWGVVLQERAAQRVAPTDAEPHG